MEAFADTGGSNDNKIKRAGFIEFSGGLGIINQDEDGAGQQHAFDNRGSYLSNGVQQSSTTPDYDMALISFDTSVELTGIDFGYRSDGDFTLLAYTGAGNFSGSNLNNSTWAAESNSGNWLTVGHYNGGEYANNTYYAVNSGGASSKYWLLGAYNSVFGESGVSNIDKHDDAFKVRKLRADTHYEEVSSPTAFGLLLFGLAGLYIRRNKKC